MLNVSLIRLTRSQFSFTFGGIFTFHLLVFTNLELNNNQNRWKNFCLYTNHVQNYFKTDTYRLSFIEMGKYLVICTSSPFFSKLGTGQPAFNLTWMQHERVNFTLNIFYFTLNEFFIISRKDIRRDIFDWNVANKFWNGNAHVFERKLLRGLMIFFLTTIDPVNIDSPPGRLHMRVLKFNSFDLVSKIILMIDWLNS